jgi:hypothetical protein
MWRRQLRQEKAEREQESEVQRQREVEMQKRILGCMQMTMRRGKQLREAE